MAIILVVDDRPTNREFLVTLLSYQGHRLLEAAVAVEGLALIRAERPDLVITDILMPEVDGFEFVRQIRADPLIANTRVIFYSANYLESEARALAQTCGVEYVIVKPAEPEYILATVHSALGLAESASPVSPPHEFERAHQRLLVDKLAQKVNELEALNAELEQRVTARTAELADANSRLRELNAFKDNLLAITSHDLRSPLGTIQNLTEILLESSSLSSDVRQRIEAIARVNSQMSDLVIKLLDLSRLESGKVELELVQLRCSMIARQALDGMQHNAETKQIGLQLIVEPYEPIVSVDWMKLNQIINNLLSNAIKFTYPGGQVTVTIGPEADGVYVSVADTGLGIPGEALPHLFEKFKQIYAHGTANERGSGLGLAIVRQLVDLHGGTIDVKSTEHVGSTFTVHLPAGTTERSA